MSPKISFATEVLRRRFAKTSVDDYGNYMSTSGHLDFEHTPAKHHRIITHSLDQLLLPMDHPGRPRDRWGEPITRLLVTAPPGSAKSTYISVQFATYYLALNPEHHVLCGSNVIDLAENFNRRRRAACRTQEWQNLAETSLDPDASGVDRFYTLAGGSCIAAGVQKAIVGVRSNLNILDDPIKSWEEAQSETQLAKIWDWYETEYRSRLVPDGLEVLMHQRWSRNDPAGVLLRLIKTGEEQGWMVVNLPFFAPEAADATEPDPMGRAPGEPLWPQWFRNQEKIKNAQRDPAKWAALWQQHPLDEEGAWVGQEHIQLIQPNEWRKLQRSNRYRYVAAGDLALSVNKGDWTVFGIAAVAPDRDLIICDIVRRQQSVEASVDDLYRLDRHYTPAGWLLDDDNATKVFERLVYERARVQQERGESGKIPPLDLMPMRGRDKEIRAAAIRGYFRAKRVFIVNEPKWAPDLIREILAFPGEPDDQVDMLGLIGRKLVQMGGIQTEKPKKQEPIEGLIVERDGQPHLSLGLNTLFEERERGMSRWNNLRIG